VSSDAPELERPEPESESESESESEDDVPCRVSAPPTVVPPRPLKLSPEASSYAVMPVMVMPKTTAAAGAQRFQPRTRAR
jgi:hypothetical protein